MNVDTGVIWGTPKLKELFGLKPDQSVDKNLFFNIVHPEHREATQQSINSMLLGKKTTVEYRICPSPGIIRWVMSRGNCHPDAVAKRALLMGITFDITDRRAAEETLRKVSGQLIQAQEEERRRLARELHDGINQRVAMIAIHLEQLQSQGPPSRGNRRKELRNLVKDVNKLSSEIQALSHELHSSKLDYLGLVAAIKGLCNEVREHQQVEIHFTHAEIPTSLPSDLALALFRITQEGLNNALKYSGVRVFEVALKRIDNEIELTISDSGIGFDVNSAMKGQGLGLISMRERVLPLHGVLSIQSQPLRGTEIKVRVPLRSV